jgi:hypothetical protein
VLILFGSCSPKVECDSPETRVSVLATMSNDHTNPLGNYAAKNSNVATEVEKSPISETAKPFYRLGEKMVTTGKSKDTLMCSGAISVTVGDTKASKEVNFTVQRSSDGKLSVSVAPFQF